MIEVVLMHGAPQVALDAPHGRERAFTDSICGRHDKNELDHLDDLREVGSCWKRQFL